MAEYIEEFIGKNRIRAELYDTVDSTNLLLKRKIHSNCGLGETLAVISAKQTAGRGRRGRDWLNTDDALLMSLGVCADDIADYKIPLVSIAAALGVADVCRRFAPNAAIKWPNDILIGGKKICGILCEFVVTHDRHFCIIGIGINLNAKTLPGGLIQPASSLFLQTNTEFDRVEVAGEIADAVVKYLSILISADSSAIISEYKKHCSTLGNLIKVSGAVDFEGVAADIDELGRLVVVDSLGQGRVVDAADVSIRPRKA